MSRRAIRTEDAPPAVGPYSQGVACDGWIFVSGQIPATPSGDLILTDLGAATRQCLENVRAVLDAAGATMGDIVKATIFLTDLSGFDVVNAVYSGFFPDSPPARACVQVSALPKGVPVEIEAIARTGIRT